MQLIINRQENYRTNTCCSGSQY